MICKNCGHDNSETSAFCIECGTSLAIPGLTPEPAQPFVAPAPAEEPQQEYQETMVILPQQDDAPPAPEDPAQQPFAAPAYPQPAMPEALRQPFAAPAYPQPEAPAYPQPEMPAYPQPDAPAYPQPEMPAYPQPDAPEAPAPEPFAPPVYPQPPVPVFDEPEPEKERSGKAGKIVLIVAVAVLALALIGACVAGYLLYSQKTAEINALEADKTALSDQIKQAAGEKDAMTADYDALNEKYGALTSDYDALNKQYDSLANDYKTLDGKYDAAVKENDKMKPEYSFYTDHAVVCSDMNKYYHTYECEDWDRNAFWIFNTEFAKEVKEYTACPVCHPDGN